MYVSYLSVHILLTFKYCKDLLNKGYDKDVCLHTGTPHTLNLFII